MAETLQLIIGSSFVGAVVSFIATFLSNRYMQNMSYKQDYYKKVIDKRIQAYEDAYHAMNYLQIINISDSNKKSHAALINRARYSNLMVSMGTGSFKGIWLTKETSTALTEINQYLFAIFGEFEEDGPTDDIDSEMLKLAEEHYEEIFSKKEAVRNQVLEDLEKLHEIGEFLREKQS